jgi:hypothetical protein
MRCHPFGILAELIKRIKAKGINNNANKIIRRNKNKEYVQKDKSKNRGNILSNLILSLPF